jgi:hypothetical protein
MTSLGSPVMSMILVLAIDSARHAVFIIAGRKTHSLPVGLHTGDRWWTSISRR